MAGSINFLRRASLGTADSVRSASLIFSRSSSSIYFSYAPITDGPDAFVIRSSRLSICLLVSLSCASSAFRASTPLPTAFAVRRRHPDHLGIEPDCQRSTTLQCDFVGRPLRGLSPSRCPSAHGLHLSCWIHGANPLNRFAQRNRFVLYSCIIVQLETVWI